MKLTRRELAFALTSAALAQTPPAQQRTAADELQSARDEVKANTEALLRIEVPMTTAPAFQFKA